MSRPPGREPGHAGNLAAGDDVAGAVLLSGQGLGVPDGATARVCPHRPPGRGVRLGVPHRFGEQGRVVVAIAAGIGSEGVDDLPVAEVVFLPGKCDSRSTGALVSRDPTMNLQPEAFCAARFAADRTPASATTAKFSMPCLARNWLMTGRIVCFSALFPSKQSISSGKPCRQTASGRLIV